MKFKSLFLALAAVLPVEALACTSLIAGKKATTDGSVLVTYAADSHTLYGELYKLSRREARSGRGEEDC